MHAQGISTVKTERNILHFPKLIKVVVDDLQGIFCMLISIKHLSKYLTVGSRWTSVWELEISKFVLDYLLTVIKPYFIFLVVLLLSVSMNKFLVHSEQASWYVHLLSDTATRGGSQILLCFTEIQHMYCDTDILQDTQTIAFSHKLDYDKLDMRISG